MTTDVVRAPLRAEVLREQLVDQNRWAALDVVDRTGSTNSDLAEAARAGAADRTVLIAEEQTAGRGRQQRSWTSPRGAGPSTSACCGAHAACPPPAWPGCRC
nr:hypothetical protein GCM10020241_44420 [Streptoalloteichus tenebrarius]